MTVDIRVGDCLDVLRTLDAESVQCCVTSPPYWGLRDYGVVGQLGLEKTPDEYVARMVEVFREVRRVLADDGTLWLNLGDSYVASPRGNKPGDLSTSSLTNPRRQDEVRRGNVECNGSSDGRVGRAERADRRARGILAGLKAKDLVGIPWRVAFALQADGWYLRSDIIWSKPNPMPESVTDRPTKAHEYLFLLTKSPTYYYDHEAVKEPIAESQRGRKRSDVVGGTSHVERGQHSKGGTFKQDGHGRRHSGFNARWDASEAAGETNETRNRRSVWTIATQPFKDAHFATFPPKLVEPCIIAGSRVGDTVLDPFGGAGTTGLVADIHGRNALLIELNPVYADMARKRIDNALLKRDVA